MSNNNNIMALSPITPQVSPPTLRPTLKLNTIGVKNRRPLPGFPRGTFTNKANRPALNSKQWGNTPFFTNAKPASMLEEGWLRSALPLYIGEEGLYMAKGGPKIEVTVENLILNAHPQTTKYIFLDTSGGHIEADERDRFEEWNFYTRTTPVPFVPIKKSGGNYKKRKTYRKRSKKQK